MRTYIGLKNGIKYLIWKYPIQVFRWKNLQLFRLQVGEVCFKASYIYENPELGLSYSICVKKGDRVLLYLPNSIEAAAMILACARIGAISVTVFAGFSPKAVADRIELTTPKIIFTQDFASRRENCKT